MKFAGKVLVILLLIFTIVSLAMSLEYNNRFDAREIKSSQPQLKEFKAEVQWSSETNSDPQMVLTCHKNWTPAAYFFLNKSWEGKANRILLKDLRNL